VKLIRLSVRRLPGIEDEFTLESLAEGLNLVVGPNASGKTSLCRAARSFLFPSFGELSPLEVAADVELSGEIFHVEREGEHILWQRGGVPCPPPDLPDAQAARCFTFGVADLLIGGDESESELAGEIRRLMAGGFDVHAVMESSFATRPRHGRKEESRLREARRRVAAVLEEQRSLASQEARLQELSIARQESLRAQAELEPLRIALEAGLERQALGRLDEELSEVPVSIDSLRGNERELLDELDAQRASLVEELQLAEREKERASHALAECGLAESRFSGAELAEWSERARELRDQERELARLRSGRAEIEGSRRAALQTLGVDPETCSLPRPGARAGFSLEAVERHLSRAMELRRSAAALDAERARIASTSEHRPRARIDAGIDILRRAVESGSREVSFLRALWIASALLGASALFLGLFGRIAFCLLLAGLGAGVALAALVSTLRSAGEKRALRNSFDRLELGSLPTWTENALREELALLEAESARAALAEGRQALSRDVEERRAALGEELRALEEDGERLRRLIGFDPGNSNLDLAVVAAAFVRYGEALEKLEAFSERESCLAESSRATLAAARDFLEQHGAGHAADAVGVAARLDALRERSERARRAEDAHRRASQRKDELTRRLGALQTRSNRFWEKTGIAAGDLAALTSSLARLPRYRELTVERERRRHRLRELEGALGERKGLHALSLEELQRALLSARKRAEALGEREREIGALEEKVREARRSERMEAALAEAEARRDELEQCRAEALRRAAGRFLLEMSAEHYDRERRPEVLKRAMDLFGRFTRHRHELVVDTRREPAFRALETSTGAGKSLLELSDGTRLQLCLAVRLAFAQHLEAPKRLTLPLFLDEALATTDPERFRAVAEALWVMAREEGRQIFYLSAARHDAARFERFWKAQGAAPPPVIDLAEVRRLARGAPDARSLAIPLFSEVPSPEGLSPEEYGARLGVAPLDHDRPVSSVHLFHILRDDLGTLFDLLRAGVETIGQWRAMVRAQVETRLVSREAAAKILARSDLAEEFLQGWRIGRGRSVDREVLQRAGVSVRLLDRLTELAGELGGSAQRLLEVLESRADVRAQPCRAREREKLRAHLLEHGYLDSRETLDLLSLKTRVLSSVDPHLEAGVLTPAEVARFVEELSVLGAATSGSSEA
jgi:energy-coupling factor transporter ATP-binding protein EcfA2